MRRRRPARCWTPASATARSENYLAPKTTAVVVRLTGAVPAGATCNWSFDDGTIPPQQVNAACSEAVQLRVRYGKPTIAAVGITRPDNSVESASTEIRVRDLLIAGLGDSVAAGEGNPDRPIALADEGFCFRRFLGTVRSEYFRPSRAGYEADKACDDTPARSRRRRHRRLDPPRRPLDVGGLPPLALQLSDCAPRWRWRWRTRTSPSPSFRSPAPAPPSRAGLFNSQGASECPPSGRCAGTVPARSSSCRTRWPKARASDADRKLDLILLTVGANDIKFSGLVADVIITSGVERVLFNQGGLIASVPQAQRILDRDFPDDFAKLRAALKPLVGGDLSRVVLRLLRPSRDAGRRRLPRRPRRPRRASGLHRRRRAAAAGDRISC